MAMQGDADTEAAEGNWQQVRDELAIMRRLTLLSHAQDNRDAAGYRACFTDKVLMDQPLIPGWKPALIDAGEWTSTVMEIFARFEATHHRLCNYLIDIDGDRAKCTVDISALHQVRAGDALKTFTVGGRYLLGLTRVKNSSGDAWLISERALDLRYTTDNGEFAQLFKQPEHLQAAFAA